MISRITMDNSAATCLVCGSGQTKIRFVYHGYPVTRCLDCGLEFVHPTPSAEDLAAHYEKNYAVSLDKYAAARDRNIARLEELERWCPKRGRLLEIGAAYGHSLELAQQRGWEVTGVELSSDAAAYARSQFGLQVFDCDLTEAPLSDGYFDAVIMWHVLEHSRNPREQAVRVAELLKPGGVVGIRVPNIESFGARATGEWWPWMCPPAHLWFFSSATLPKLLDECGFDMLETRTLRGDGNNLYQYALIWLGRMLNKYRRRLVDGRKAARTPERKQIEEGEPVRLPERPVKDAESLTDTSGSMLDRWMRLLKRSQRITNALARGTQPLVASLERRGLGDELLVYGKKRS